MKINAIIFHTSRLHDLRDFYEGKLQFQVGTYIKENQTVPDSSETYVNYHFDHFLLCFEEDAGRTDIGTIVLNVPNLEDFQAQIKKAGLMPASVHKNFIKLKDPEGRSLIIESAPSF